VEIQRALAQSRINVTVSQQSSTRLDMEARGLTSVVRASVHYYNSEDEVEGFCATLAAFLSAA
jgi:cysteine desulfurase/selenocysteine lyase